MLPQVTLNKDEYDIRDVIVNMISYFTEEFSSKKVTIILPQCYQEIYMDLDTISVSLFYILENAVKYIKPSTELRIFFDKVEDGFQVKFRMISVQIDHDEADKLSDMNYRGNHVRKSKIKGMGIGMYRINKTLRLNNAKLIVEASRNELEMKDKNFN